MEHRAIARRPPRSLLIPFVLVLSGCANPTGPPREELPRRLAGLMAGPPQACVTAEAARNLAAPDPATIVYDRGSTIYVNRLAASCPGLGNMSTIIVQATSAGQYCRGDRFRTRAEGSTAPGPDCLLGEWVPYRR